MQTIVDIAAAITALADLADEVALDLEESSPGSKHHWDQLHALHGSISVLGSEMVNLLSSSNKLHRASCIIVLCVL